MTRALIRWMRVVHAEPAFFSSGILVEMLIEGFYLFWWLKNGFVDEVAFRNARLAWLGICAFVQGVGRVALFHPVFNDQYEDWLNTTPWRASLPLPGGPIHQVPQDLIVIAALMLLTRDSSVLVLTLPIVYLLGYFIALAVACRTCGDWIFGYLLGFCVGGIGLAGASLPQSCVVAMACYPIAFIAIRRSLNRFPWDFNWSEITKHLPQKSDESQNDRLGWPYDLMSPSPTKLWLPYHDGICLSLLAGWFALIAHFHFHESAMFGMLQFMLFFFGSNVVRLAIYAKSHWWPISFAGRILTLRWIIPKYDVIFVAPLLAMTLMTATQGFAAHLYRAVPLNAGNPGPNWPALACSTLGIVGGFLVLLVMGPVLERWRLEGRHRIVFGELQQGKTNPQSQFIEI